MAKKSALMRLFDILVSLLVMIALINWGLVGWFQFNLVEFLFRFNWLILTVYTIVSVVGTGWMIRFLIKAIK